MGIPLAESCNFNGNNPVRLHEKPHSAPEKSPARQFWWGAEDDPIIAD